MNKQLQFVSDYKQRSKTIYPQDINKSIPERDCEALAKINVCTVGVDAKRKKKISEISHLFNLVSKHRDEPVTDHHCYRVHPLKI